MNFGELKLELQKRSIDLGQIKRPEVRYGEALNHAASMYPLDLWPMAVDSSTLDTVAETRIYALSGVSGLTTPEQVRRVWIDDGDGVPRQIGRYEIQDSAGTLSLVLDEEPDDAYDITLEYRTAPEAMSASDDTTGVDDAWLLDKAMALLLSEADPTIEDPNLVQVEVEKYNTRVLLRERQLLGVRHRPSRRVRSTAWRSFVK